MSNSACRISCGNNIILCIPLAVPEQPTVEEEGKDLWEADWDDEDTTEDFQQKLRQELERHMKE